MSLKFLKDIEFLPFLIYNCIRNQGRKKMYNSVYGEIEREYEKKRTKAIAESDKRKKDLIELYP